VVGDDRKHIGLKVCDLVCVTRLNVNRISCPLKEFTRSVVIVIDLELEWKLTTKCRVKEMRYIRFLFVCFRFGLRDMLKLLSSDLLNLTWVQNDSVSNKSVRIRRVRTDDNLIIF
jgi:hypothetical protein